MRQVEIYTGSEFSKQLMWIGIGFVIMIITSMINYELYQRYWMILYAISIILLIGVLFMPPVNGATSWYNLGFMSFQPSELAKICVMITMPNKFYKQTRGYFSFLEE